ncbi:uncharacterized protein LOC113677175 [Pocillopora damicornis]|nr:uncharacterized protein LOC113677175 [Pocillopora damicornis]
MNSYFAYLWLKFGTILLLTTAISSASNQMETPLVFINNTFMDNISIENHTIQTVSVLDPWECFRHCAKHCDCVAFQVSEKICELLGTDIDGAIGNQVKKPGTRFYHMQQNGVREHYRCLNGCCQPNPCLNGGTCVESCDNIRKQYTCACPRNYQGKRCEIFHPRVKSCQSYIDLKPESESGVYNLNDTVQTYCDFDSEAGKVWTLIQSFSLENKAFYKREPFYFNFPRNETRFNWNDFRVSYQAMVNIRDNSTHWRVTCNFPSGLDFTDYARATLQATDILTFVNQDRCRKYEYISVRGQSCTDCSGMIVQRDTQHMHTDSYWSGRNGCFWDPRIGSVVGEDNFGFYNTINTQHSCTENSLSTTQWWLGAGL